MARENLIIALAVKFKDVNFFTRRFFNFSSETLPMFPGISRKSVDCKYYNSRISVNFAERLQKSCTIRLLLFPFSRYSFGCHDQNNWRFLKNSSASSSFSDDDRPKSQRNTFVLHPKACLKSATKHSEYD